MVIIVSVAKLVNFLKMASKLFKIIAKLSLSGMTGFDPFHSSHVLFGSAQVPVNLNFGLREFLKCWLRTISPTLQYIDKIACKKDPSTIAGITT